MQRTINSIYASLFIFYFFFITLSNLNANDMQKSVKVKQNIWVVQNWDVKKPIQYKNLRCKIWYRVQSEEHWIYLGETKSITGWTKPGQGEYSKGNMTLDAEFVINFTRNSQYKQVNFKAEPNQDDWETGYGNKIYTKPTGDTIESKETVRIIIEKRKSFSADQNQNKSNNLNLPNNQNSEMAHVKVKLQFSRFPQKNYRPRTWCSLQVNGKDIVHFTTVNKEEWNSIAIDDNQGHEEIFDMRKKASSYRHDIKPGSYDIVYGFALTKEEGIWSSVMQDVKGEKKIFLKNGEKKTIVVTPWFRNLTCYNVTCCIFDE